MLSKKLVSSLLLFAFLINISLQLTISEDDKEKIKKKIDDLSLSEGSKENIKRKLAEVINIFKEEITCKDPKWCDGFKVSDCETPITNKTVCCLYCAQNTTGDFLILKLMSQILKFFFIFVAY